MAPLVVAPFILGPALGSWVSVLGSSWPIFRPNPRNHKPQHRQKCSVCPARLPGGNLGCLVAFSFPCGPVAIPFPSRGAAVSRHPVPWVLRHKLPILLLSHPERTHNTQHAVPYLLYIHAGRLDLTIDISATEIISPITIIICTQDLPHLSLAFIIWQWIIDTSHRDHNPLFYRGDGYE